MCSLHNLIIIIIVVVTVIVMLLLLLHEGLCLYELVYSLNAYGCTLI